MKFLKFALPLSLAVALVAAPPATTGMTTGKANLKSAGPLAFGPDGVLFIGDSLGAQIIALDTGDTKASAGASVNIAGVDAKIAAALGTMPDQIAIRDIAVNPTSHNVYISVSRGKGADAMAVLLKLDAAGKLSEVNLDNVKYAAAALPNAASSGGGTAKGNQRMDSITEVRYMSGKVLVAGLSNEEFQSNMRSIPFPFEAAAADKGANIEMYHGSHGRYETNSPVRTFVPYTINNQQYILAAYTCTPLVKIPVSELKGGAKVKGTTIAEFGAGNVPLDMIAYNKGGKPFILMANNRHGVLKVDAAHLDTYKSITAPTDITGVPFEHVDAWQGVQHLQLYDNNNALVLSSNNGVSDLKTIALP
ncbi:MAG TPA: hypothetical protein VGN17_21730 [Bryobacteraceae bacterium]|jgi:hypothetical protein